MTDKQALRLAANEATKGHWIYSRSGFNSNVQAFIELPRGGNSSVVICKLFRSGWRGEFKTAQDAAFIAAANPATILALLNELEASEHTAAVDHEAACSLVEENEELKRKLEAAEKRIAELEVRTVKLPDPLMPAQHNSGELFMTPDNVIHGGYLNRDDVLRNLRAAGIKVIEGEQKNG